MSAITCIPPTASLLKNAEKDKIEEEGWVISSSIDYTMSVLKYKKAEPSQCTSVLPVLLFLLVVLLFLCLSVSN